MMPETTNWTLSKEKPIQIVKARSAGFVLIHPVDLVQNGWQYLLLKHSHGSHWGFPKGTVEPGESDWQTAIRELEEETGITSVVQIAGFEMALHYQFQRIGRQVEKTVVYFLAQTDQIKVILSPEHTQYRWFSYDNARTQLTHTNSRQLLDQAKRFLTTHTTNDDA